MRAPLTAWPVSWAEVARDIRHAAHENLPGYVAAALQRVRADAEAATRIDTLAYEVRLSASERPMTLRRFGDTARDEGELSGALQFTGERFAFRLQATAVADAADGKDMRADGSYVGMALGNWMLSAGYLDRWWGPGWEGSLILGTNARPLPSITIERNYSDAFEHPWLAWIGRWRLAVTFGQFEGGRSDAPDARFFGMRATLKPHPLFELGLSRSAQWCGEGLPCDLDTFLELLAGNDSNLDPSQPPGNQLGGIDLRWVLPWAPLAIYLQAIGEDEANYLPSKYLGLFGAEVWGGIGEGSWRAHLEYADTACVFYENQPQFGCAYRNVTYLNGYQYRGRSVGHALDGDSRQWAAGLMFVGQRGESWELAVQDAKLNRAGANPVHSVSPVAAAIRSADLYHRRAFLGGELRLGVGYEEREVDVTGIASSDLRGFAQWSAAF